VGNPHRRATGESPAVIGAHTLPSDASEHAPSQIYLSRMDGRLSWRTWLATYRDRLPAYIRSPIQVLTGPDVEQLRWSRFKTNALLLSQAIIVYHAPLAVYEHACFISSPYRSILVARVSAGTYRIYWPNALPQRWAMGMCLQVMACL